MNDANSNEDFAARLAQSKPLTPEFSSADVMFETGRQAGVDQQPKSSFASARRWQVASCLMALVTSGSVFWSIQTQARLDRMANAAVETKVEPTAVNETIEKTHDARKEVRTLAATNTERDSVISNSDWWLNGAFALKVDPLIRERYRAFQDGIEGLPEPTPLRIASGVSNSESPLSYRQEVERLLTEQGF